MRTGLGVHVRLGDDNDMQWLHKLLVEQLRLGQTGLEVPPTRVSLKYCTGRLS